MKRPGVIINADEKSLKQAKLSSQIRLYPLANWVGLFILFSPLWSTSQDKQLVLTHINVIDIRDGNLTKDLSVVIYNNRITDIGRNINFRPNATIINARGKFLIPGLWDMHVHLSYYGEEALEMLVANGITGVRDMGGDLDQLDRWRSEIALRHRVGPRIKRAGPFIDGPKKMNARRRSFTRIMTDDNEVGILVDSLKMQGTDFLKVHSRLPRDAFFKLADEAIKKNIRFAVHVPKELSVQEVSDAGARSIEHTESLLGDVIYEEDDTTRNRRTEEVLQKLYGEYGDELATYIADNKNFYDPTLISLFRIKGTAYEKMLAPRLLPVLRKLVLAKVPLLAGSDFADREAGIRPGFDLHDELGLFVNAGMKPLEALRAATINPVECLYMTDSLGTIEKGKIADLVILNKNPLENISATKNIYAVVLDGKYLSRKILDEMLRKTVKKETR